MAHYISSQFLVNGLPRNNAVVTLFDASAFPSTPPAKNTPKPSSGALDTTTTGTQHGADGAYRFSVADAVELWACVEWNGLTLWDYFRYAAPATADITNYGAVGNGSTDCTAAINAAVAALTSGGTVTYPQGTFKCSGSIEIPYPNIILKGTGKRNTQAQLVNPSGQSTSDSLAQSSTHWYTGSGSAFHLQHTNNFNGFQARDLTVLGNASGSANYGARCFGFDLGGTGGAFRRDFVIESCTINWFDVAIDLYASATSSGSQGACGVIRIERCSIQQNNYIAKTASGLAGGDTGGVLHWNNFIFRENEATHNTVAASKRGIQIQAACVNISDNLLEGQKDPVYLRGAWRGLVMKNNYFELNTGTACIDVSDCYGPIDIGPNLFVSTSGVTYTVLLTHCGPGICHDPAWLINANKLIMPTYGTGDRAIIGSSGSTQYSRIDSIDGRWGQKPLVTALNVNRNWNNAAYSPVDGCTIPVQIAVAPSGSNNPVTRSETIAANANQWVVLTWALRRDSDSALDPYIGMRVNDSGSAASGSADFRCYYYNSKVRIGEWMLITCAVQPLVAMTTLMMYLYPYGTVSVPDGLNYTHRWPTVYVVDDINDLRPYFSIEDARKVAAAPTSGTWVVGDRVFNSAPAAGGAPGWVCTTAGTPGTWKAQAVLAA